MSISPIRQERGTATKGAIDRRTADQDRDVQATCIECLNAQRQLARASNEQSRKSDRVRVCLVSGFNDAVDRHLLAEVIDAVAGAFQNRVQQGSADVVDVAW